MSNLNQHNYEYYLNNGTAAVPDLLSTAVSIQEAIRLTLESQIQHDPIKVIELGFGSRPNRYTHILSSTKRNWNITLSDFSLDVLPTLQHPSVTLLQLNLLTEPFPAEEYDVILSTYLFDSIDFPEDRYQQRQHYPGGLIRIAKEAVKHLTPNGIFLTIDKNADSAPLSQPAGGARFKTLNLQIAADKLTSSGLTVKLETLNEFLERNGQFLPLDLSDHGCLTVINL